MENNKVVLKAEKINKFYGRLRVLCDINITLEAGSFLAVFGANGAGKSTLLKVFAMLLKPNSGSIFVNGVDVKKDSETLRKSIGVVFHDILMYNDLTALENLKLYGRLYNVKDCEERIEHVMEIVGFRERSSEPIRNFSRGMQQRLAIARAFLHNPSFLLLDEPYAGLDQKASDILNQILKRFHDEGRSAIIATHNIEQGLEIADEIAVLKEGYIIYENKKEQIDVEEFKKLYPSLSE